MRHRLAWSPWALFAALVCFAGAGYAEDKPAGTRVAETTPASGSKAEFVGAETCIGCHADKESSFKHSVHGLAWPNAKGIDFSRSCETCHGPGSLHAAAGGDKSNADFFTINNPREKKGPDASKTCLQCHQGGTRMHWSGSTHDAKNVSCVQCHSMHAEKVNDGKSPMLTKASVEQTCFQCHADKKAQIKKSAHMPIGEGKMTCTSCHNPHGSPDEKLMAKNTVMETCYECHADKRGPFLWEHPPAREDCRNCHNPHGSHNDRMLITKSNLLCQRCHSNANHPSNNYDDININRKTPQIFNRGCVNCHSKIHGSNHPGGKYYLR
ncbi:MAG: DmsE family decaheme c-type cytochrome [Elusimicrobia bacterium]|nr:DmsE family decaheme c-type cytochrome [Elusimicrobiota bacterium]